jgi:tRNA pseudouridine55 synthase
MGGGGNVTTDGLVIVDKPGGMTSHDVVSRMRRIVGSRKVGHAGTLDPMATGVLVIGVNRATRLMNHLILADKTYLATIRLGVSTTTDDAEGQPTGGCPPTDLSGLDDAVAALTGAIMQVPSSVSAIKINGERAYKLVRAGESVELQARPVTVSRFEITATRAGENVIDIDAIIDCSSGTYVRALARDLGNALGVGGHLTALRRTRVGPFRIEDAYSLERLAELDDPVTLPLAAAVRAAMPLRLVDEDEARELSHGRSLPRVGQAGTHAAIGGGDVVIALLLEDGDRARPVLVFTPAG